MPLDLVPPLTTAALRATGLGLVTARSLLLFRIQSSAVRHAVWTIAMAGMLLQLPLGLVAPTITVRGFASLPASMERRAVEPAVLGRWVEQALAPATSRRTESSSRRV